MLNYLVGGTDTNNFKSSFPAIFFMPRLYRPQFVVPKIQQTSFRDPEAMAELSGLIRLILGSSLTGKCQIPLGRFNDFQYSLAPFASLLQVIDKARIYDKQVDLAPNSFFCLQKRDFHEASSLEWGGSPTLAPSGCVRIRKASSHSHASNDSGYESGDAKIPEHTQTAGGSDNQCEIVMSHPFFMLGRLKSQTVSNDYAQTSDYIVAVSLYDESLWAIYDAWDETWVEDDEELCDYEGEQTVEKTAYRPFRTKPWGRFPGLDNNAVQQMVKIADNVCTHPFSPIECIRLGTIQASWQPTEVPFLLPCRKGPDGSFRSLFESA